MKGPSLGVLAGGAIGIGALTLALIGAPHDRPPPVPAPVETPPPPSVTGNGFTLASTAIDLPADDAGAYPAGPNADLVNARCSGCHSASMVLTQPTLSADQWKAEVTKMREVYKAPVAESDTAAIVAYLVALPGQHPATPPTTR